ncbi:MAG: FHA domain-containing protein [Chloroflexota bacterium]
MSEWIFLGLRILLAVTLYAFLGTALWLLWRDLHHRQQTQKSHHVIPLSLSIELGDTTRQQQFTTAEVIIGRDPNCACVLDSNTVSAHHARLSYHHQQWWVEDLDSTNGTLLNDQVTSESVVLTPGDQLRCGDALLTVLSDHSDNLEEDRVF